ncbi:MAG TPA: YitT family protein [Desulfomicrobiaceae bacterium]|nr:YitT family protein [Desulfomicrobiaceae bacterium]
MKKYDHRAIAYSVPWNLGLLTVGSIIIAIAIKGLAIPHGLISGGLSGVGLLLYYMFGTVSPATWLLVLNIPVMILGWIFISRRFILYSLYGMVVLTASIELIDITFPVHDNFLAALSCGCLFGAGTGICFRSLGSVGGTDIIAVMLHQKFNFRIGQVGFAFNGLLFGVSFFFLSPDPVLYSLTAVFVASAVTDYFISMFNQRKMVLIVSNRPEELTSEIMARMHRGSTYLFGRGAYTGTRKKVIMTVINNIQQKQLEELIFTIDPDAFVIQENTFNVLGKGFSRRKIY